MQCIDFSIHSAVKSPVLPQLVRIEKGLTRITVNQHFATVHTPGKIIRIVDLNNFAVLHCIKDTRVVAAACFNPIATLNVAQPERKRVVLLYPDGLSTYWTNETQAPRIQAKCLEGHVLLNNLIVGQLQRVYFLGRSQKQLTIFALDHISRTVRALISSIQDISERVTLAELDSQRLVLSQGRLVRVIDLHSQQDVNNFILPFEPTSCHTFRGKFVSFFNAANSELHSFCISSEDHLIIPTVVRVLDSNPVKSAQLISVGSDALFLLNECERFIQTFNVSGRVKYAGYNPVTQDYGFNHAVASLKTLCFETMRRAHRNRRSSPQTVFAHHFDLHLGQSANHSLMRPAAQFMPLQVERRPLVKIDEDSEFLLNDDDNDSLSSPFNDEFVNEWLDGSPSSFERNDEEDEETLVLPLPSPSSGKSQEIEFLEQLSSSLSEPCADDNDEASSITCSLEGIDILLREQPPEFITDEMQTTSYLELMHLSTVQHANFKPMCWSSPPSTMEEFRAFLGHK